MDTHDARSFILSIRRSRVSSIRDQKGRQRNVLFPITDSRSRGASIPWSRDKQARQTIRYRPVAPGWANYWEFEKVETLRARNRIGERNWSEKWSKRRAQKYGQRCRPYVAVGERTAAAPGVRKRTLSAVENGETRAPFGVEKKSHPKEAEGSGEKAFPRPFE